jgi:hypothetical protein
LRLESLRPLAEGWDNAVWVVDEQYAFRFPRREIAIPGVELELAVLPKLAQLLPLPVPDPFFRGRPAEGYPWPFFGSELLSGRETCDAQLDDEARLEVALQLAGFLRTLHFVELDGTLPVDANSRADLTRRVQLARRDLGELERLGLWRAPGRGRANPCGRGATSTGEDAGRRPRRPALPARPRRRQPRDRRDRLGRPLPLRPRNRSPAPMELRAPRCADGVPRRVRAGHR